MALDTDLNLRRKIIYQVFPRQYSPTHDFKGVTKDLDRIKDLGTDILYLLPIHPIGVDGKKGELGCPYSIKDYSKIDPHLGTLKDFKELIEETHKRGMKIIIDCVYNHTSRDSVFFNEHKEFYKFDENGNVICKVPDWSDVYDINYENKEMQRLLISYLKKWVKLGVDGFRCDVCSLVPYSFWVKAKKACKKINEDFFLLGETVDKDFGKWLEGKGYPVMNDKKALKVFDIIYDYENRVYKEKFMNDEITIKDYLKIVNKQQKDFPSYAIISRCVDNHDLERIASFKDDEFFIKNMTALTYFLPGAMFIYAGDEVCTLHRPSLFDYDEIDWTMYNKYGIVDLLKKIGQIKHLEIFKQGNVKISCPKKNVSILEYENESTFLVGVFNFTSKNQNIALPPYGEGKDLISNKIVKDFVLTKDPMIIEFKK